jgi:hypothetical protein
MFAIILAILSFLGRVWWQCESSALYSILKHLKHILYSTLKKSQFSSANNMAFCILVVTLNASWYRISASF